MGDSSAALDPSSSHTNPLNPCGGGMGSGGGEMGGGMASGGGGMAGGGVGMGGGGVGMSGGGVGMSGGGGAQEARTVSGNSLEDHNQGTGLDGDSPMQMNGGGPEDSLKQRERNRYPPPTLSPPLLGRRSCCVFFLWNCYNFQNALQGWEQQGACDVCWWIIGIDVMLCLSQRCKMAAMMPGNLILISSSRCF
jgi:hypothetical protein